MNGLERETVIKSIFEHQETKAMPIQAGKYYELEVLRKKEAGLYLDDGADGILLPTRYASPALRQGDIVKVFVYHDSEDRLIATTLQPKAVKGEIVLLNVVDTSPFGAFMDWGLPKDLFVPKASMKTPFRKGGAYLVQLTTDSKSGRLMGTQYFDANLGNEELTVKEKEIVTLTVYRQTDIGYVMIINHRHTGVLHDNEVYQSLETGDIRDGYISKIRPDNTIDVRLGKPGFIRTDTEADKILVQLHKAGGFLPYHDKTDPAVLYEKFGISKKAFKQAIGRLYKERKIIIMPEGCRLV